MPKINEFPVLTSSPCLLILHRPWVGGFNPDFNQLGHKQRLFVSFLAER